jgi:spore germination protein YaaH
VRQHATSWLVPCWLVAFWLVACLAGCELHRSAAVAIAPGPVASAARSLAVATTERAPSALSAAARGPLRGVTVWLPYWSMSSALASTLANAGAIDTASPYWYAVGGVATVEAKPGAGDAAIISQLLARRIRVMPMVTEDAGIGAFARLVESPGKRAALVRALVSIAKDSGYSGLDLDFENLASDPRRDPLPADRIAALYPRLVAQACAALHAIARECAVTVMPRTTSAHVYWHRRLATWVYDYGALAKVADRVQIMAYDEHSADGPAGPIAPLDWVQQVIAYARSQMGFGRVELGVPAYGYDWPARQGATALTAEQAPQLAAAVHAHLRWSAVAAEETFTYHRAGRPHTVWYENATADYDRASLAAVDGLAGVAIWAAGDEDPAVWAQLRRLEHAAR